MSEDNRTLVRAGTTVPERRVHPRKKGVVPAYLIFTGQKPRRCQVIDLSASGVQLDVGRFPITPGKSLEMVFVTQRGGVNKVRRINGIVVRRANDRIGVAFLRPRDGRLPKPHAMSGGS